LQILLYACADNEDLCTSEFRETIATGMYENDDFTQVMMAIGGYRSLRLPGGRMLRRSTGVPGPGPTRFSNQFPKDKPGWAKIFTPQTLQRRTGRFAYVVKEDGTLVLGRRIDGHVSLANGEQVRAAGEVRIKSGRVTEINNISGHYRTHGKNAAEAAVRGFRDTGFNIVGEYVEYTF
jgi:hypothetical protein